MAAKIEMHCTGCDRTFQVPSEWAGKLAQCKCGNQVLIGEPEAAAASSLPATSGRSPAAVLDASVSKFIYSLPDSDGDTSISVQLQLTNTASRDIEFLQSTTILFDGSQNPISVSQNADEVFIAAGDSEKVDLYVGYFNVALVGGQPDRVTAQIHLIGCSSDSADLGTLAVSDQPFSVSGEQVSRAIGESATVQRLCAWSTLPDEDDNTVEVQVHAVTENVTDDHIFKIQIKGQLLDNNSREIEEMEHDEELPAGATGVLESSFWGINPKRLDGASIRLSASVFPRIAAGQLSASEITRETDEHDEDEHDENEYDENEYDENEYDENEYDEDEHDEDDDEAASQLTVELAEQFLVDEESVWLGEYTDIDDAAAEVLSNFKGEFLDLDGLTNLSDAAAQSLSTHKGHNCLGSLTELSASPGHLALAESFSNYNGAPLFLDGLTSLSDAAAEVLGKLNVELNLNGLTSLSDAAAESLCKHKGDLWLNGLTSLSDAAAESLSNYKGESLYLNGLTSLSDAAAESLSNYKGEWLNLDGLTSLSDTAAESLSKHKQQLNLDGLTNLSAVASESLSKHKGGYLSLNGLTTLLDTAAKSLAGYEGILFLNGLTELSDEAAESLSKHEGSLGLDLDELPVSAVEILRQHPEFRDDDENEDVDEENKKWWKFQKLIESGKKLSPEDVVFLQSFLYDFSGDGEDAYLEFSMKGHELTAEVAQILSKWQPQANCVSIYCSTNSLSDEAALALSKWKGNGYGGTLFLPKLRQLSDVGATHLLKCVAGLGLNLKKLPESAAQIFSEKRKWEENRDDGSVILAGRDNWGDDDDEDWDDDDKDWDEDDVERGVSVREEVMEMVADQLGEDAGNITPESKFQDDLKVDSLDLVELVMAVEDMFGISVPDEDYEKIVSVGDAITYIDAKRDSA